MYLVKVREIVANILFLESLNEVDGEMSFEEMGFTSIDFIDFCYEVKAQINAEIEPHDIWPFTRLLVDPLFYFDGHWTDVGRKAVSEILDLDEAVELDSKVLNKYWTPVFCARRIERVLNV